jgi:hypothetical protein
VKTLSRFSFPEMLEMSEFCTGTATSIRYKLFNVIVYSGNGRMGVNIGFIRPQKDCSWYRFDGEVITPATESEVFETAFCGSQFSPEGLFVPATTSQQDIFSAASIYVEPDWSGLNSKDTSLLFEPNNLNSSSIFSSPQSHPTLQPHSMTPLDCGLVLLRSWCISRRIV